MVFDESILWVGSFAKEVVGDFGVRPSCKLLTVSVNLRFLDVSDCVVVAYKRSGTLRKLRTGKATARTGGVPIRLSGQPQDVCRPP